MLPKDTGKAPGKVSPGMVWTVMKTLPVPTDIFAVAQYYAGKVSGVFRARISYAHHGRHWCCQCLAPCWCADRKHEQGVGTRRQLMPPLMSLNTGSTWLDIVKNLAHLEYRLRRSA